MFSRVKPNNFLIPSLDHLIFKYAALSLFCGPCFTCLTLSPQISVIIAPNVIFENEVNNLLVHVLSKMEGSLEHIRNLKWTRHKEKLCILNWVPDTEINHTCWHSICVPKKAFGFQLTKFPMVQTWNFATLDQYQYLGNCPPNPPLTQQQSSDKKLKLMLGYDIDPPLLTLFWFASWSISPYTFLLCGISAKIIQA